MPLLNPSSGGSGASTPVGPATSAASTPVTIATDQVVPTTMQDAVANGTISTQNLVPAGAATANSAVSTGNLNGMSTASIQTVGTYTGALSLQATVNGSTWVTLGGTPFLNVSTGAYSATIPSAAQGLYQVDIAGFKQFRISGLAAMTGSVVVSIQATAGAGMVALDAPLPTGANVIGALTANQAVNVSQIAAVAPTLNAGAVAAGTLRTVLTNDGSSTANPFNPTVSTTGDTGAKTTTFNGATITNNSHSGALIVINMGAVTGTTPTLVAKLQGSADGGTSWVDIPGATTASIAASGLYGIQIYPGILPVAGTATPGSVAAISSVLPKFWRLVYTIGGSTPSFTITNVQVSYSV